MNESRAKFHDSLGEERSLADTVVLTKSGEERLIEWRNRLLRDDEGRVIGRFSSGADITERNRAVEALRTAEERMRFALKNADVGIWDMDGRTGAFHASEILEAQFGVQPGGFAGTFDAFVECVHPDDRSLVLETARKAMATGTDFSLKSRVIWPDGTVRWLIGAGRFFLGEDGQPVRGVGISQDVTERTRDEEALKHVDDEIQAQRVRVLKATMRTVQDIVNNGLMSLCMFRSDVEGLASPESLRLFDQIVGDTAAKLQELGDLDRVVEKSMVMGVGIDVPSNRTRSDD